MKNFRNANLNEFEYLSLHTTAFSKMFANQNSRSQRVKENQQITQHRNSVEFWSRTWTPGFKPFYYFDIMKLRRHDGMNFLIKLVTNEVSI